MSETTLEVASSGLKERADTGWTHGLVLWRTFPPENSGENHTGSVLEVIEVHTTTYGVNTIRKALEPSHSATWLIGDRRRSERHCLAADTPRTRAALVIASLVGFGLVATTVAVIT